MSQNSIMYLIMIMNLNHNHIVFDSLVLLSRFAIVAFTNQNHILFKSKESYESKRCNISLLNHRLMKGVSL